MDVDLMMAQYEAETELKDKCRITREGSLVWSEEEGQYTPGVLVVYEGPCSLRNAGGASEKLQDGREVDVFEYTLKLPFAKSGGVRSDDIVLITASRNAAANVGRKVRVKAHRTVTHATLRRLPVEEATDA